MSISATSPDDGLNLSDEIKEIHEGLNRSLKSISPKFFYDDAGSKLFDAICDLPEYYPTRTELGIMQTNIDEIATLIGEQASLIEFGSGSSLKTRTLLENLHDLAVYVPVDISREHLLEAAEKIRTDFTELEVLPVAADFTKPFRLPSPRVMPLRNIVYFPGSTIGNFSAEASLELLKVMHHEAGKDGALLIGVDLQKKKDVLEAAYNDSVGVTAQFNLNVLRRLNREYGGTFDLDGFRHRAIYNEKAGRIEMYLDSVKDQTAEVGGKSFQFAERETINTEHSHKYTLQGFAGLAQAAGFRVEKVWMDAERLFSVQYCVRD
jgi:L-histidine N-alpha-methyltransferase